MKRENFNKSIEEQINFINDIKIPILENINSVRDMMQQNNNLMNIKDKHIRHYKILNEELINKSKADTKIQRWLPDHMANNCKICTKKFGLLLRKHHCWICGDIFCANCCVFDTYEPYFKNEVRMCNICHEKKYIINKFNYYTHNNI